MDLCEEVPLGAMAEVERVRGWGDGVVFCGDGGWDCRGEDGALYSGVGGGWGGRASSLSCGDQLL